MTTALLQSQAGRDKMRSMRKLYRVSKIAVPLVVIFLAASVLYWALYQLPYFGDFDSVYYPVLFLDNPYDHIGFLNPPWVLVALYPLKVLPPHAAGAVWMLFSVVSVLYCARQLGADRLAYLLIFINPAFIRFMTSGQLDALVLYGLVVNHPGLSVLLLTIKPQVIGTAVLFRLRHLITKHAVMIAAVVVASFIALGNWPAMMWHNWSNGVNHAVSMDIFPYGTPIGAALLWWSIKNDKPVIGALASYFFAPYVSPSSVFIYSVLIFSTFATIPRIVVFVLLWIVALVLT